MTERKPAIDVVVDELEQSRPVRTKAEQRAKANRILAALTAAGYPVEAGPATDEMSDALGTALHGFEAQIGDMQERIDAMREALEQYAEPDFWRSEGRASGTKPFRWADAMTDRGQTARAALALAKEPKP